MNINTLQVLGEKTDKPYIRKFALKIPKSYEKLFVSGATYSFSTASIRFNVTIISNNPCNDMITADFIAADLSTLHQLEIPDDYVFLNTVISHAYGNSSFHSNYAVFMKTN